MKSDLKNRIEKSQEILKKAFDDWGREAGILCDFSKSDVVMLHLIRDLHGEVMFPVLFIDHKQHFPEIYEFKETLRQAWNLKILTANPKKEYTEVRSDKAECCYWLKTEPFLRAVREANWKACYVATHSSKGETVQNSVESPDEDFYRILPLLHWSETDVWRYIRLFDLPYCSIYDKGYKTINCKPCSKPIVADSRGLREETPDKDEIVKRLQSLGYF